MKKSICVIFVFLSVLGLLVYQVNKPKESINQILERAKPADVYEIHDMLKKNYPEATYSQESNGIFAERMQKLSASFTKKHSYISLREGIPSYMLEITVVEIESRLFAQVDHYYVTLYFDSSYKFLGYEKE